MFRHEDACFRRTPIVGATAAAKVQCINKIAHFPTLPLAPIVGLEDAFDADGVHVLNASVTRIRLARSVRVSPDTRF
jgi:hypothetical protein